MPKVMWTPRPHSRAATVILPDRPTEPLTKEQYLGWLEDRLDQVFATAEPEARAAAEAAAFAVDRLDLVKAPGPVLVENSTALANLLNLDSVTFPINPQKMRASPMDVAEAEALTLPEMVDEIYSL